VDRNATLGARPSTMPREERGIATIWWAVGIGGLVFALALLLGVALPVLRGNDTAHETVPLAPPAATHGTRGDAAEPRPGEDGAPGAAITQDQADEEQADEEQADAELAEHEDAQNADAEPDDEAEADDEAEPLRPLHVRRPPRRPPPTASPEPEAPPAQPTTMTESSMSTRGRDQSDDLLANPYRR
jgi:hypothetical protein